MTAAQEAVRKTFDGMPIEDAKADFSLKVRTADIKVAKGHEKDFSNCILAKACARQVGATKVAFMRAFAYLEMPDAKGRKRLLRYHLDKDAAAIVAAFDRGKAVRGEVMVALKAPCASQTLDAGRRKYRQLRERRRQAVLKGEVIDTNASNARYASRTKIRQMDVRNGTGMVHNVLKVPKKSSTRSRRAS